LTKHPRIFRYLHLHVHRYRSLLTYIPVSFDVNMGFIGHIYGSSFDKFDRARIPLSLSMLTHSSMMRLFSKRDLQKRRYSAKETYDFKNSSFIVYAHALFRCLCLIYLSVYAWHIYGSLLTYTWVLFDRLWQGASVFLVVCSCMCAGMGHIYGSLLTYTWVSFDMSMDLLWHMYESHLI